MNDQTHESASGYVTLTEAVDPYMPCFKWRDLQLTPGQVDLLRLTTNGAIHAVYYDIGREKLWLRSDSLSTDESVLPDNQSFELTIFTVSGKRLTYAFRTGELQGMSHTPLHDRRNL